MYKLQNDMLNKYVIYFYNDDVCIMYYIQSKLNVDELQKQIKKMNMHNLCEHDIYVYDETLNDYVLYNDYTTLNEMFVVLFENDFVCKKIIETKNFHINILFSN